MYPIILHTCDSYEKWWLIWYFFYKKYMTSFTKIYFLTEEKNLPFESNEIIHIKTGKGEWGERLIYALERINEEYVYYSQEDFWAKMPFNTIEYEKIFHNYDMDALRICFKYGSYSLSHIDNNLYRYNQNSQYLMNHQFSLWNKSFLLKYINPLDSPWHNEISQTKQIEMIQHKIYLIDKDWFESSVAVGKLRDCGINLINSHDSEINEFMKNYNIEWKDYKLKII